MSRFTLPLFLLVLVAIGGAAAWYLVDTRNDALGVPSEQATTTPELTDSQAIYTNGTYGFAIFYPESAVVEYEFTEEYRAGTLWRVNALPDVPGTSLVAIIPYTVRNESAYPRHFSAFVRVGASQDPRELERCEKADTTLGETALPDRTIAGRTWKVFSFGDAGMMQYLKGISYRTVHEGRCIALEQIQTGSSYRETVSEGDIPQETLDAAYEALDKIVQTFSFAR